MARDPSPSGIPDGPIFKPLYGQGELNVDGHVGSQHAGLRRVRRSFAVFSVIVAVIVAWVALAGNTDSAWGMATIMLVPLLMILVLTHLAVLATRPEPSGPR